MKNRVRVVVVDDHYVVRTGVITLLKKNKCFKVVGEGAGGDELFACLAKHQPHILVVDLQMPEHANQRNGPIFEPILSLKQIQELYPDLKIVILTQVNDIQTIQSMAEIGIPGYVLKSDNFTVALERSIEVIHKGGIYFSPEAQRLINEKPIPSSLQLSPRLIDVLRTLIQHSDLTREEQASLLGISDSTMYKHVTTLRNKLNAPNVEALIVIAMRQNLLGLNPTTRQPFPKQNRFRK